MIAFKLFLNTTLLFLNIACFFFQMSILLLKLFILSTQPFQQKYDPNNKIETWGSDNYDAKFDVLRVPMKTTEGTLCVEQFTIGFINMTQQGGSIAMWWDTTMVVVEVKVGP